MTLTRRQLLLSLLAAPFVPSVAQFQDVSQITTRVFVRAQDGLSVVSYISADTFTRPGRRVEIRINGVLHTKGVVEFVEHFVCDSQRRSV